MSTAPNNNGCLHTDGYNTYCDLRRLGKESGPSCLSEAEGAVQLVVLGRRRCPGSSADRRPTHWSGVRHAFLLGLSLRKTLNRLWQKLGQETAAEETAAERSWHTPRTTRTDMIDTQVEWLDALWKSWAGGRNDTSLNESEAISAHLCCPRSAEWQKWGTQTFDL